MISRPLDSFTFPRGYEETSSRWWFGSTVASGWRVNNERVDSLKFFVLDTRSVLFRGEWKGELRRIMENEIGRGDRFRGGVK